MKAIWLLLPATVLCLSLLEFEDELVIHEWGTFTSLQDEQGNTVGGINIDDEPVPDFVHTVGSIPIVRDSSIPFFGNCSSKCSRLPAGDPSVTMRLETPVVYFYPARDQSTPFEIDVDVEFRGGWLTQFYPFGDAELGDSANTPPKLSPETHGTLSWRKLLVGGDWAGPETTDPVWLSPREVEATSVQASNGEAERYLFYRGIGQLDAPLQVTRDNESDTLSITANFGELEMGNRSVARLWLVDIRDDSRIAFRRVPDSSFESPASAVTAKASFDDADYSENLTPLWDEMEEALVDDGLYHAEAQSMLKTWEASYFRNPGTRLFFLVPDAWTNHYLPIRFSLPAKIERVMVGRIELINSHQREILKRIGVGPAPDLGPMFEQIMKKIEEAKDESLVQQLMLGRLSLTTLRVDAPPLYREYLSLGRFREVLLREELKRASTPAFEQFARNIGIPL